MSIRILLKALPLVILLCVVSPAQVYDPFLGVVVLKQSSGAGSGDALTTDPLSQFAATTSAQLKGVISDENGAAAGAKVIFAEGVLNITAAKTFTVSNTLTISGTDGSSIAFGAGGTVQYTDAELTALAGLTSAADKVPYFTGSGTAAVVDFPSQGRALVALAATDDNLAVANGTTWQLKALPDCDDSSGNHLNYDTGTNAWTCGTSSSGGGSGGSALFTTTADAAANNTTAETSIVGTGVGSKTTAAGYFAAGTNLLVRLSGYYSTPAVPDNLTIRIKAGSTVVGSAVFTLPLNLTNQVFVIEALVTCRTAGASGTFILNDLILSTNSTLTATISAAALNTSTVTLDTTGTLAWDITADWGAAQSGQVITGTNFVMYTPGGDTELVGGTAVSIAGGNTVNNLAPGFLVVDDGTGSDDTYTGCPTGFPAAYSSLIVDFVPLTANTNAATLNICALGALAIKLPDGTTDPTTGDLAVGRHYSLRWVDDATDYFRLAPGGTTGALTSNTYVTLQAESNLSAEFSLGSLADNAIVAVDVSGAVATPRAALSTDLPVKTLTEPMLNGFTLPDTSGSIFMEPYSIKATNDFFLSSVWIYNDTSTDLILHGKFRVPDNFVSGAKACVVWTSTATSGNVRWQFGYRSSGGDDTTSLDQATNEEAVEVNDVAPTATDRRLAVCQSLTDANIAAGDTFQFRAAREGSDTGNDTMAAAAIVFDWYFEYQGR